MHALRRGYPTQPNLEVNLATGLVAHEDVDGLQLWVFEEDTEINLGRGATGGDG